MDISIQTDSPRVMKLFIAWQATRQGSSGQATFDLGFKWFLENFPKAYAAVEEATAQFETIKAEEVEFGRNNFIEVARKKAIGEGEEREFVSISRGYYLPDKSKRWRASITLPDEKEKIEKIAKLLKSM